MSLTIEVAIPVLVEWIVVKGKMSRKNRSHSFDVIFIVLCRNQSSNVGMIAGIIVGIIFFLLLLGSGIVGFFIWRKQKQSKPEEHQLSTLALDQPSSEELSTYAPISKSLRESYEHISESLKEGDDTKIINYNELIMKTKLGVGNSGEVRTLRFC